MDWTEQLAGWLHSTGRKRDRLAAELGQSPDTVERWLVGNSVPDRVAQEQLRKLGAPVPGGAASEPEAAGNGRVEDPNRQILEALERIEAKIDAIERRLSKEPRRLI